MSIYLRKNALPIFIEIIFVVSCFFVPQEYYIYSNLLFYLLLFADFYVKREFSFRKWVKNLKGGKTFWKQVIVTTVFFLIVFGLTTALESFFPNLDTGMIMLKRDTPARLIAFAISTMFLPAITEESFYRKSIISFRSKPALVLSAVFGMLLYAAEHSLKPWGIFLTAIWALPLTISYIRTKNVYVPMTAHFIVNVFGNGVTVIMDQIKIGKFIAALRKDKGLTQEQLGEKLGVTNKTISRWENGNYMPDVEMLSLLSKEFGVSINELISGERLWAEDFKKAADDNLVTALNNSTFTLKEKIVFFKKKWLHEHISTIVLCVVAWIGIIIWTALKLRGSDSYALLGAIGSMLAILFYVVLYNRMMVYVENHAYRATPDKETETKN